MKLRGKTLIFMAIIILSLILSIFAVSQFIFIESSAESENSYTNLVLKNTINSLNNDIESLNNTANDWSSWDDAYDFVSGTNPSFINHSLINETFSRLNINLIIFTDSSGNIVYARAYDPQKSQDIPLPSNLSQEIIKDNITLSNQDEDLSGVLILNGTPLILASKEVVKSSGEGPSRGTLIMGRYLVGEEVNHLSDSAIVTIEPFNGSNLPTDFQKAKTYLTSENQVYVTNLNSSSMAGYGILEGITGEPALILKIESPRFIYQNYQNALFYLILSLIIVGLIAATFITYYLDKNVLYRLDKITSSIVGIGKRNDLSGRVPELGDDELNDLSLSVNKMLQSLQESNFNLEKSEKRYRTIFENTGTAMVIIDDKMGIKLVNTEFERSTGLYKEEIENKKNLLDFVVKDQLAEINKHLNLEEFKEKNTLKNYEIQLMDKKGEIRDYLATIGFIPGTKNSLISLIDVTEHKKAENQVKASLKEKEILLREIHHRVKNNLQVISTLLFLQSGEITDPEIIENYRESENRIQSIALIHEKMYQSTDLSSIDFTSYINSFIDDISHSYDTGQKDIKIQIDTGHFYLSIETVQPLGLIINELISNSLKYAFKGRNNGIITISLEELDSKYFKLTVSDNGIGLPEDLDFENSQTLGLLLVNNLVEQLEGTIRLIKNDGTIFEIIFKEPEYKKRI
jgi:PAS domain S-box-containing protein